MPHLFIFAFAILLATTLELTWSIKNKPDESR